MDARQRAYLQRIEYTGETTPTLANLRALHRAHMMAIPFENLDIHVGRWITLDEEKIFHKIVDENRGGFCFEQNGLFSTMLEGFGYDAIKIEANVRSSEGRYGVPMAHMALIVQLEDKRWLADVGFGDSFLEPLHIDTKEAQIQGERAYKIEHDGETGYMMRRDPAGDWVIQYRFYFMPHELADYTEACHYMQTSPDTHFTQKRICSLAVPQGRISLSDTILIETINGKRTETTLSDEAQVDRVLWERFRVDLTPAREAARPDA